MDTRSATEPLTVDQEGNAPKNRITSASAAWGSYQQAFEAALLDDARFSSIRGIFDGMPPVDPAELTSQGLQDAPNFNTRQFSSKVKTYVSTWIDSICGGNEWFIPTLKRENFDTAEAWSKANDYSAKCFNEAIGYWDDVEEQNTAQFIFENTIAFTQMGLFGLGVMHFQDEIDWRPCMVPTRKVYPSRGTKIMLNNCQAMFLGKPYSVCQLYDYVRDPEAAKASGWNREAVLQLLYQNTRTVGNSMGTAYEQYSEWENRMRNNDLFLRHDFRLIDLIDMYVQEFNTKRAKDGISHYVIHQYGGTPSFLYENDRQYKRWTQIIIPFCDDPGPEGDWHGIKGFGDSIFDLCHHNNIFLNAIALAAMMTMMPMFQSGSESDREKLNQIVFSRLGILFPDMEVSQVKIQTDISGGMAVVNETNRVMDTNTRIFPQNQRSGGGDQPTATQVSFDRQDQAQFTSLQLKFQRMTGSDRLGFEMYKRISQPAEKYPEIWPGGKTAAWFRKRMKDYGLTHKQYSEVRSVRSSRSGGSGNMALDNQKADQVLAIATPGRGQLNARMEKAKALYGADRVEEFVEETPSPMPQDQVIGFENTTFQNGQFVPAYPFDDQLRHLNGNGEASPGHLMILTSAEQAAEQIDEQGIETALPDAMKIHKVLEATLAHCMMHAAFLESNKFNEQVVKDLNQVLNTTRQFTENFQKSIERALQKQQQAQQQANPDPEMAKAQAQIQIDGAKAAAEIERKNAAHAQKLVNLKQTHEMRAAGKEADHAQKLGIEAENALVDNQRTKLELQADAVKTQMDLAKTRAKHNTETATTE